MTQTERERLGNHIAAIRKEKGLSIRDLADASGMSRGALSHMENGARLPRPETLSRIAEALGVEWEDLYALAGYGHPEGLPSFGPYLRSRYGDQLSAADVAKLEATFRDIARDADQEAKQ